MYVFKEAEKGKENMYIFTDCHIDLLIYHLTLFIVAVDSCYHLVPFPHSSTACSHFSLSALLSNILHINVIGPTVQSHVHSFWKLLFK